MKGFEQLPPRNGGSHAILHVYGADPGQYFHFCQNLIKVGLNPKFSTGYYPAIQYRRQLVKILVLLT
jgi:hypothetical protein